jgi:hypothetical protein
LVCSEIVYLFFDLFFKFMSHLGRLGDVSLQSSDCLLELLVVWPSQHTITLDDAANDGEKTIQVLLKDGIGTESSAATQSIILDTVAPEVAGSGITINSGGL